MNYSSSASVRFSYETPVYFTRLDDTGLEGAARRFGIAAERLAEDNPGIKGEAGEVIVISRRP